MLIYGKQTTNEVIPIAVTSDGQPITRDAGTMPYGGVSEFVRVAYTFPATNRYSVVVKAFDTNYYYFLRKVLIDTLTLTAGQWIHPIFVSGGNPYYLGERFVCVPATLYKWDMNLWITDGQTLYMDIYNGQIGTNIELFAFWDKVNK